MVNASEISDSHLSSSKRSSYSFQLPVRRLGGPILSTQQALHGHSTRDEAQLSRCNGFLQRREPPSQAGRTRQPVVELKLPGAESVLCALTLRTDVLSLLRVTAQATRVSQTRLLSHTGNTASKCQNSSGRSAAKLSRQSRRFELQKNHTCGVFQ